MDTVVAIPGGGLVKDEQSGLWRTTRFNEKGDNFGVLGDRLRIDAAAVLAYEYPDWLFILSGGKGQLSDVSDVPYIAEVMAAELEGLGVSRNRMFFDKNSGNTYSQLYRIQEMIMGWDSEQQLLFLSNRWQLFRIQAMVECAPELKALQTFNNQGHIGYLSAENILVEYYPAEWKVLVSDAYASESVRERIALELQGVGQILGGTYTFRLTS